MQTSSVKLLCKFILVFVLLIDLAAHGQGLLVGPSMWNGSFEEGVSSPWGGIDGVSQDAGFASDGEWFATVQSTARTSSWLLIPVDLLQGRGFIVSFDARVGASGFGSVSVYVNARNADGTYPAVYPAVTTVSSPPLSSGTWSSYEAVFHFSGDGGDWDGSNIRLGLDFGGGDGMAMYDGFFDNVVLEQIPEPCSLCLLVLGLGAVVYLRRRQDCLIR